MASALSRCSQRFLHTLQATTSLGQTNRTKHVFQTCPLLILSLHTAFQKIPFLRHPETSLPLLCLLFFARCFSPERVRFYPSQSLFNCACLGSICVAASSPWIHIPSAVSTCLAMLQTDAFSTSAGLSDADLGSLERPRGTTT